LRNFHIAKPPLNWAFKGSDPFTPFFLACGAPDQAALQLRLWPRQPPSAELIAGHPELTSSAVDGIFTTGI
jgi:hypothetical protein